MRTIRHLFAHWRRAAGIMTTAIIAVAAFCGAGWWQARYDDSHHRIVELTAFSNAEYSEDPEDRSRVFGNYPHRRLQIEQIGESRFRFLIEPEGIHATAIELPDIDLAPFVAAVPPWVKSDPDLIKIGLIDREWNRQQVSFRRDARVGILQGGDGFEQRALSRVDIARNCLKMIDMEKELARLNGTLSPHS